MVVETSRIGYGNRRKNVMFQRLSEETFSRRGEREKQISHTANRFRRAQDSPGHPMCILGWRILGTEEPGGLPSMGLHRVRHD